MIYTLPRTLSILLPHGERMNRSLIFWTLLVVVQAVVLLAVYGITRQYYFEEGLKQGLARAQSGAASAVRSQAGVPHAMPAMPGGADDDLARLISAVPAPGQANLGLAGIDPAATPVELARRGDELFSQGQYPRAAELYAAALERGDDDVNTYNSLGLTLHYLGRTGEALQVLDQGIQRDANYQRIWLTLGFVNGQIGHVDQAREALGRAVQLDPDSDVGRSAADMMQQLPGG